MKIEIKTHSGKAACFVFCFLASGGITFRADYLGEDSWIITIKGATPQFAVATNDIVRQNCSQTEVELSDR